MEVWLDLEQTIISIWDDPVIANKDSVKRFLKDNDVTKVNIFSFAIWNNGDRSYFERFMKSWLEREFEFEIVSIPTLKELMKEVFWKQGVNFTLSEFCSIWGKERAFNDYIRVTRKEGTFALIDDTVSTTVIHRIKEGQIIKLFNVDELKG